MDEILKKKLEDAVWVAHSLFERGKTSGSSANMSFLHDGWRESEWKESEQRVYPS